jgi:hypothetical protein
MEIDPRAARTAALITTAVFIVVLITGSAALLAAQALVFAIAVIFGMRRAPYALVFRFLIRPWLGPPRETEPEAPPRFAQGVGLVVSVIGVIGYATGATTLGIVAAALGLIAAFLNGAFGLCLGCEMYLFIRRITPARQG